MHWKSGTYMEMFFLWPSSEASRNVSGECVCVCVWEVGGALTLLIAAMHHTAGNCLLLCIVLSD